LFSTIWGPSSIDVTSVGINNAITANWKSTIGATSIWVSRTSDVEVVEVTPVTFLTGIENSVTASRPQAVRAAKSLSSISN